MLTQDDIHELTMQSVDASEKYHKILVNAKKAAFEMRYRYALLHLGRIELGMQDGQEFVVKYYGRQYPLIRIDKVYNPSKDKSLIRMMNIQSIEIYDPQVDVLININGKEIKKRVAFSAITELYRPENIDPAEYVF